MRRCRGAGGGRGGGNRCGSGSRDWRWGWGGGRSRRCGSGRARTGFGFDPRHDGLNRNRLAFLHQNLRQYARRRCRDLGVHLVRGYLEDRFVTLDRVADLLHPARNGPLGDGLAHLGHDDVDAGHVLNPP